MPPWARPPRLMGCQCERGLAERAAPLSWPVAPVAHTNEPEFGRKLNRLIELNRQSTIGLARPGPRRSGARRPASFPLDLAALVSPPAATLVGLINRDSVIYLPPWRARQAGRVRHPVRGLAWRPRLARGRTGTKHNLAANHLGATIRRPRWSADNLTPGRVARRASSPAPGRCSYTMIISNLQHVAALNWRQPAVIKRAL